MKPSGFLALCCSVIPVAARADDSAAMHAKMQALMDSVALGDKAPWIATLDKRFVQIDESGVRYDYGQSIAQVTPLPKGASGDIKVVEWKATIFGDSAVSTHLDDEHENFHGQKLHALYRSTGTWLKESGDWKLIAMQTIALRQDPPAVELPGALTDSYVGRYRDGTGLRRRDHQKGRPSLQRHEWRQAGRDRGGARRRALHAQRSRARAKSFSATQPARSPDS